MDLGYPNRMRSPALHTGRAGTRYGSLCLELGGTIKGPRSKIKVLNKEPIPFTIWEKQLAGGGGSGIFVSIQEIQGRRELH